MSGLAANSHFFLLQLPESMIREGNPRDALILLIIIIAIVAIIVIYRLVSGFTGGGGATGSSSKGKKAPAPRRYNVFALRRISSSYGLDREQTKLLEFVFRNDAVYDPTRAMSNPSLLDRHFKKAFRTIERNSTTDEEAQQQLAKLFSLRTTIESAPSPEGSFSKNLSENTPAILSTGKESFSLKVILSRGKNVVTEVPKNTIGSPIRLPKGMKVTLSFFINPSNGFSYDAQIVGVVNTDFGPGLQITHTGKMKPLVKRSSRRKHVEISCDLFFVNVEETGKGRKKTSKLVVDPRKFTGTLQDISAGGCSIKSSAPIQVGSRLKITINYEEDSPISVLGQVLRSNRSSAGTIIHVKFLKVPRRAFNSICTLVYGYNE